jgi:hypothetical protein
MRSGKDETYSDWIPKDESSHYPDIEPETIRTIREKYERILPGIVATVWTLVTGYHKKCYKCDVLGAEIGLRTTEWEAFVCIDCACEELDISENSIER